MLNIPEKTMTIYDIPQLIPSTYPFAMMPSDITPEICPINCGIFTDVDFAPSSVTNREHPTNQLPEQSENQKIESC